MATLLQIGGLINLEERSGSFLPELPYTNRGVIRQKEELSALIDWCQITIKEVPLEVVYRRCTENTFGTYDRNGL